MSLSEKQPYTVAMPKVAAVRKTETERDSIAKQTKTAVSARFPDQGS